MGKVWKAVKPFVVPTLCVGGGLLIGSLTVAGTKTKNLILGPGGKRLGE